MSYPNEAFCIHQENAVVEYPLSRVFLLPLKLCLKFAHRSPTLYFQHINIFYYQSSNFNIVPYVVISNKQDKLRVSFCSASETKECVIIGGLLTISLFATADSYCVGKSGQQSDGFLRNSGPVNHKLCSTNS